MGGPGSGRRPTVNTSSIRNFTTLGGANRRLKVPHKYAVKSLKKMNTKQRKFDRTHRGK